MSGFLLAFSPWYFFLSLSLFLSLARLTGVGNAASQLAWLGKQAVSFLSFLPLFFVFPSSLLTLMSLHPHWRLDGHAGGEQFLAVVLVRLFPLLFACCSIPRAPLGFMGNGRLRGQNVRFPCSFSLCLFFLSPASDSCSLLHRYGCLVDESGGEWFPCLFVSVFFFWLC